MEIIISLTNNINATDNDIGGINIMANDNNK